jgi:hypothetical protein
MLLPLRWLLYSNAGQTTGGTRRNRKIQRKLRRLAQWSEAELPPILPQPKAEDVTVRVEPIRLEIQVAPVTVVAEIGLFDYEIAVLIDVMETDKKLRELQHLDEQIRALDNAMAPFSDWSSIEITRSDSRAAEESAAIADAQS